MKRTLHAQVTALLERAEREESSLNAQINDLSARLEQTRNEAHTTTNIANALAGIVGVDRA